MSKLQTRTLWSQSHSLPSLPALSRRRVHLFMQGDPYLEQQTDDRTQHTTPSPQSTDAHHGRDDIRGQQHRQPAGNSEQEVSPAAGDDGAPQFDIDGSISRAEKLRSGGWGKAKSRRRIESAAASSAWKAHGVSRRPPLPSQPRDPPIACLPVEGLAAIFARLHPEALKTCALVCKAWQVSSTHACSSPFSFSEAHLGSPQLGLSWCKTI